MSNPTPKPLAAKARKARRGYVYISCYDKRAEVVAVFPKSDKTFRSSELSVLVQPLDRASVAALKERVARGLALTEGRKFWSNCSESTRRIYLGSAKAALVAAGFPRSCFKT